jgi:colanic acid biosynthesis glycosyl transferase WcaI
VIRNWAPVEEYGGTEKRNSWSEQHGLANKFVFLYSGTLGIKHNPAVLLELANRFAEHTDVRIVVISEGPGADWLQEQAQTTTNLIVLGFQPNEKYPEVLASGDVLVTLLDAEAGTYSVPSKILSYMCAGRPILASIPAENLGTRIIQENAAGIVTSPLEIEMFYAAANVLRQDTARRKILGDNAAAYAQSEFKIENIAPRFEAVLSACLHGGPPHMTKPEKLAIAAD